MKLKVIFLLSIYIFPTLTLSNVKRADVQTSTSTERVDIHRTITPSPGNPITGEEHYHSESSKLSVTASPKTKRNAFRNRRADVQTSTSSDRLDIHRELTLSPGNPVAGENHYHSESSKVSVTEKSESQTNRGVPRSRRSDEETSSPSKKNTIDSEISSSPKGPGMTKMYNTLPHQQKKKRSASNRKRVVLKNKRSDFQTSTSTEKVDIHREITPSPENSVSGEVNYHFESKKTEGTSVPKIKRYLNKEESYDVDMLRLLQHNKPSRFIRSPQEDQSASQNEVDSNSNKDEGRRLDEDRQKVEDEKKKIQDEKKIVEDEKRELEKQKEQLHEEEDRNKKERDDIEQMKKELEERKNLDDGEEENNDAGESRKYEDRYDQDGKGGKGQKDGKKPTKEDGKGKKDQDGDEKPGKKKGEKGKKGDGNGEGTQDENEGEPEGDDGKGKGSKKPTKKKEKKDKDEGDQDNEDGEEPEEEDMEEEDDGKKKPKDSKQKPAKKKNSKDNGYYRAQRPGGEEEEDECDYFIYIIQPEPARPKPRPIPTHMQPQRPSQRPQWSNNFGPQQMDFEQGNKKPSQTPVQPSRPTYSQPQMNGWTQELTPMGHQGYPFSWNQWAGQRRPGQSSSWSQPNRRPSQNLGSYGYPYGYSGFAFA